MSFTFRPAIRENVNLLIGIAGGTGSGKTYSAMRLAKGICGGKKFAVIDTENGRARHYADQFDFDVCDLSAPFRPDSYADAIVAADKAGYEVIVVDSMSHVWAGDGGVLDWQEEELDRMAGDDWKKREAVKMAAWIKPKMSHKHMVQRLLQVKATLILCFRAEPKIEMVKENGKMVIQAKQSLTGLDGWIPVCEKNLPFELTVSLLMTADAPGFPKPIKLQEQHRTLFPLDVPVAEESGRLVALWASGGDSPTAERVKRLEAALHSAGVDKKRFLQKVGLERLSDIEEEHMQRSLDWITRAGVATKPAKMNAAEKQPAQDPLSAQALINRMLVTTDVDTLKADYELIVTLPADDQAQVMDVYNDRLQALAA